MDTQTPQPHANNQGKQIIISGGVLLLLGVIASRPDTLFGGIGGWALMVLGVIVIAVGAGKRAKT